MFAINVPCVMAADRVVSLNGRTDFADLVFPRNLRSGFLPRN